jgi:hypothetical protein
VDFEVVEESTDVGEEEVADLRLLGPNVAKAKISAK